MINKYEAFSFLSSPVAVYNSAGGCIYSNEEFRKNISQSDIKRISENRICDKGIIFTHTRGVVRCYLISADEDDEGHRICIYKEITDFVSRKSMTEIIAYGGAEVSEYAEHKIVQKNLRLSSLVDSLESGVLWRALPADLIQVNNSFLKIISQKLIGGLPEIEYNAAYYHKILSEIIETKDYFKDIDRIISENRDSVYTDEVTFKDGRVYMRTFRQLYIGDQPKGYLWKFKDITIRKELESFNIELEANLRALESSESVGIYMEYSGYRFVNEGLLKPLEIDRETLMCEGLGKFISGEIFTGKDSGTLERTVQFERADGSKGFLNLVSDSVMISGKTAHVITLKDSTSHILLQKDLEMNENRFRNIFEKNLAVMLIFDPETMKIVNANQSALEFYGKSYDELVGLEMCDITVVDDMSACMSKLNFIVHKQEGSRIPLQQVTADGSLKEVELLMTPLGEKEGGLLFVIVDDVHERKRYQQELESLNGNLIEMVEKEAVKRRRQEEAAHGKKQTCGDGRDDRQYSPPVASASQCSQLYYPRYERCC